MIKYADLVNYIKENHVNWNTDLFDVLKGFFEQYPLQLSPTPSEPPIQQNPILSQEFKEPEGGEYTVQDLLSLLST